VEHGILVARPTLLSQKLSGSLFGEDTGVNGRESLNKYHGLNEWT
jgi:hypothetical protein